MKLLKAPGSPLNQGMLLRVEMPEWWISYYQGDKVVEHHEGPMVEKEMWFFLRQPEGVLDRPGL